MLPEQITFSQSRSSGLLLSSAERQALQALINSPRASTKIAQRARIVLAMAEGQTIAQVARSLGVEPNTVRLWRQRWLCGASKGYPQLSVLERLADAPRSGRRPTISAEQLQIIKELAAELRRSSARPLSTLSNQELANEIISRGIVHSISARHAARLMRQEQAF